MLSCSSAVPSPIDPKLPAVQRAGLERAAAAESVSAAWIDELELRIDELGPAAIPDFEELQLRLRASLIAPWERSSTLEAASKARDYELERLDEALLEERVAACERAVEARYGSRLQTQQEALESHLALLSEWGLSASEEGALLELEQVELELDLEQLRFDNTVPKREHAPAAEGDDPLAGLPEELQLDASPETVATLVAQHPLRQSALAEAAMESANAAEADARRWPWLRFVELGFQVRPDQWEDSFYAQLAIDIPLGSEASAERERREALARSAEASAEHVQQSHASRAALAISTLNGYFAEAQQRQRLRAAAELAIDTAARWGDAGLEEPGRLAAVLRAAMRAQRSLSQAERDAGRAACELLEASGTTLSDWPRL
ncbi:MAG: hypothetical protein RBU37_07225 [Myxococcota bacterium]|nr:hypothetical protein [Myxococcota bacterium]